MLDQTRMMRSLIAVVAAITASAITVGAAVGPAQAVTETASVSVSA